MSKALVKKPSVKTHKKACAAYESAHKLDAPKPTIEIVQNQDMMDLYNSVIQAFHADDKALRRQWWHGFGMCTLVVAVVVILWGMLV
jgi:hypothetical protein